MIPHKITVLLAGIGVANIISTIRLIVVVLRKKTARDESENEVEERRRH